MPRSIDGPAEAPRISATQDAHGSIAAAATESYVQSALATVRRGASAAMEHLPGIELLNPQEPGRAAANDAPSTADGNRKVDNDATPSRRQPPNAQENSKDPVPPFGSDELKGPLDSEQNTMEKVAGSVGYRWSKAESLDPRFRTEPNSKNGVPGADFHSLKGLPNGTNEMQKDVSS